MRRVYVFLRRVTFDTLRHFSTDDGWALASHVALSGILALFPFLIFATSLASFLGASAFTDTAVHVVFDTWPEVIARPIAQEVRNVLNVQRGGLLTISVIAAAYFASNGIEALRIALNRAYRVVDTRSIIYCRLQSLGYVIVATVGIMAISFLLVLAPLAVRIASKWVPELDVLSGTIGFWRYCIASAVLIVGLLMVLINQGAVSKVASLFYLVPGVTALMAYVLFGETLTLFQLCGMVVATLGVALSTGQKRLATLPSR